MLRAVVCVFPLKGILVATPFSPVHRPPAEPREPQSRRHPSRRCRALRGLCARFVASRPFTSLRLVRCQTDTRWVTPAGAWVRSQSHYCRRLHCVRHRCQLACAACVCCFFAGRWVAFCHGLGLGRCGARSRITAHLPPNNLGSLPWSVQNAANERQRLYIHWKESPLLASWPAQRSL